VVLSFGGVRALDGVSFWVPPGGAVGLLGQNGSGKTTLLNVITGQLRPQSGRVLFGGASMVGRSPEDHARAGIARVFQSVQVFPRLTVLENLLAAQIGSHGAAARDRVDAAHILERVGLTRFSATGAGDISYGHQRLLEIGMALATRARLVLLDEPTAGLAPAMVERIVAVLRAVNGAGTALVIIEHETDVVFGVCETVWVMNEGRMIARGSPEAIQADPQVRELYLGAAVSC
jgi:ABC-type branched-subunit amino acid transport system ATPase component